MIESVSYKRLYALARTIEVFPEKDGTVKIVRFKTENNKILLRPLQ